MIADLTTFRRYIGAVSTADDEELQERLDTARAQVEGRVYADSVGTDPVEEAILILGHRLYKRRQSPEGTAGFGGEGVVIRIMQTDPDIKALLERNLDMGHVDENGDVDPLTAIGIG